MIKPFRVLSIDWDYLVNATMEERIMMFPDGGSEKFPDNLSQIIWTGRYAENPKLLDIGVDFEALDIIKDFISTHCHDIPVIVKDSHGAIWDSITKYGSTDTFIEVINIDFHHDAYVNDMSYVDCGNWVNCLFENRPRAPRNKRNKDSHNRNPRALKNKDSHYYWIARKDSDDRVPMEVQQLNYIVKKDLNFLKTLDDFECDLLFICRSGFWSPPHMDNEFMNFYDWCIEQMSLFTPYSVSREVEKSRYTEKMCLAITEQRKAYERIRKECNTNGKDLFKSTEGAGLLV